MPAAIYTKDIKTAASFLALKTWDNYLHNIHFYLIKAGDIAKTIFNLAPDAVYKSSRFSKAFPQKDLKLVIG